ncbi:Uncharacterised protein [Corynebacterium renale]|nr:Uncharacterised protein [Corynebacterium renale]STC98696.1 Uncharacterised protein [Corynebacterium renale]
MRHVLAHQPGSKELKPKPTGRTVLVVTTLGALGRSMSLALI